MNATSWLRRLLDELKCSSFSSVTKYVEACTMASMSRRRPNRPREEESRLAIRQRSILVSEIVNPI